MEQQVLQGKKALVIGATGGIGSAVASHLHQAGAGVAISGRNQDKLTALTEELGEGVYAFQSDMKDNDAAIQLINEVWSVFGPVDLAVIASGVFRLTPIEQELDELVEKFELMLEANLRIPAVLALALAKKMQTESKSGLIVNISSHSAKKLLPDNLAYGTSKAAISAFMARLDDSLRETQIRILDILPASVDTSAIKGEVSAEDADKLIQPEEIAELIVEAFQKPDNERLEPIVIDKGFTF